MIRKFKSIEEGLTLLEQIDAELKPKLESGEISQKEYKRIQMKLNQRKAIISQMNKIREQKPLEEPASMAKLKKIYQKNQELLGKIAEKQGKILKRLKDREKSVKKNKNFPY